MKVYVLSEQFERIIQVFATKDSAEEQARVLTIMHNSDFTVEEFEVLE